MRYPSTVILIGALHIATLFSAPADAEEVDQKSLEIAAALPRATPPPPKLTKQAAESARLSGVDTMLDRLAEQQKSLNLSSTLSLETLQNRQRFLYLRTKISDRVQAASLQIDASLGNIDASIAQIDELRAYLTEKRNRITHRNSQINLLSGGFTKMIGYGYALAPVTAIPTNLLEIFDGGVQASLSALALREEHKESKLEHGTSPMLTAFFNDKEISEHYPPMVWHYLNSVPSGDLSRRTRREELIANWKTSQLLDAGKAKGGATATVQLLEQRMAMLSDIKAVVTQLHNDFMQLANIVVLSYEKDPEF